MDEHRFAGDGLTRQQRIIKSAQVKGRSRGVTRKDHMETRPSGRNPEGKLRPLSAGVMASRTATRSLPTTQGEDYDDYDTGWAFSNSMQRASGWGLMRMQIGGENAGQGHCSSLNLRHCQARRLPPRSPHLAIRSHQQTQCRDCKTLGQPYIPALNGSPNLLRRHLDQVSRKMVKMR